LHFAGRFLVLTSSVNQSFLGAHHSLKEWQGKNQDDTKLSQKFEVARQKYALHELLNIFSFYRWYYELKDFREELNENREEFSEASLEWLKALAESQEKIQIVADKFKEQITALSKENPNAEENEVLRKRVKDASNYFSAEIQKWKEKFYSHPFSTDKKKVARYLDASLTEVAFILHEILHRVNHCKTGFTLNEYLKSGKKVETAADKIQSSYAQNQEQEVVVDGTANEELYSRLAGLRKQIASKANAPLYMVFSSDAIHNVCKYLPQNKESLLKIKGFGKAKVGQYGDEVIQLVRDYCEEYNLQPQEVFPAKRERKPKDQKTPTVDETVNHFKTGKSIADIAAERKLTVGTIEGHLAQAIKLGSIEIEQLIPIEEVKELAQHFPAVIEQEYAQLNAIKEKVSADVSFGKLKMVLAWIQRPDKN
jgi:DNA-binding CsgD family transcriptional regulator